MPFTIDTRQTALENFQTADVETRNGMTVSASDVTPMSVKNASLRNDIDHHVLRDDAMIGASAR